MSSHKSILLRRIRFWLAVFIAGLVLSGVTAFPLVHELRILDAWIGQGSGTGRALPGLGAWISRVHHALEETAWKYPFLAYGYDWLAFAHLVIAAAFWGPWKDPVRNLWVVHFGIIACAGIIPLWLARRDIVRLAAQDPRLWT